MTKASSKSITGIAICSLLAACGGAPSNSDIKSAVDRQIKTDIKNMESFGAGAMARSVEIQSVNKIGCKEDGEKAYRCDVELEVKQGDTTKKGPASMRFIKGSDGWMVTR